MNPGAADGTHPADNSRKSVLTRACDPRASLAASRAIPPLIGNPEYVPTTNDAEFIKHLESRAWSVVFLAPGACWLSAANRPIPGGNSGTRGWTLEQYRDLVHTHQGKEVQIVETLNEQESVGLLQQALHKAPETANHT